MSDYVIFCHIAVNTIDCHGNISCWHHKNTITKGSVNIKVLWCQTMHKCGSEIFFIEIEGCIFI